MPAGKELRQQVMQTGQSSDTSRIDGKRHK